MGQVKQAIIEVEDFVAGCLKQGRTLNQTIRDARESDAAKSIVNTPADVIERASETIEKVTAWISVAVTVPTSVSPSSIINVEEDVNTGTVVSTTLTVLVSVPALPEASVDV